MKISTANKNVLMVKFMQTTIYLVCYFFVSIYFLMFSPKYQDAFDSLVNSYLRVIFSLIMAIVISWPAARFGEVMTVLCFFYTAVVTLIYLVIVTNISVLAIAIIIALASVVLIFLASNNKDPKYTVNSFFNIGTALVQFFTLWQVLELIQLIVF